jgi:pantetheine-phosphate adenylyltransferase
LNSSLTFQDVKNQYNQPHRFHHNLDHLEFMMSHFESKMKSIEFLGASIFHDWFYDPLKDDAVNVDESITFMEQSINVEKLMLKTMREMIKSTKDHSPKTFYPSFAKTDAYKTLFGEKNELVKLEKQIRKEYQFVPYREYKKARIEFLKNFQEKWTNIMTADIEWLIDYIENRDRDIAYYPGSFSPFHKGHQDVLNKAKRIFDEVKVLVGQNLQKDHSEKEHMKRLENVKETVDYAQVEAFSGYLHEYVPNGSTIVKGLRNFKDFNYEKTKLRTMEDKSDKNIDMTFIIGDRDLEHVSSTMIRQLENIDPEMAEEYRSE